MDKILSLLGSIEDVQLFLAGALITQYQWSKVDNLPEFYGISDLDIVYFDKDLSYEKEDYIIQKTKLILKDYTIPLDIKNQARVHLWRDVEQVYSLDEAVFSWELPIQRIALNSSHMINFSNSKDNRSRIIRYKECNKKTAELKYEKWSKLWSGLTLQKEI